MSDGWGRVFLEVRSGGGRNERQREGILLQVPPNFSFTPDLMIITFQVLTILRIIRQLGVHLDS